MSGLASASGGGGSAPSAWTAVSVAALIAAVAAVGPLSRGVPASGWCVTGLFVRVASTAPSWAPGTGFREVVSVDSFHYQPLVVGEGDIRDDLWLLETSASDANQVAIVDRAAVNGQKPWPGPGVEKYGSALACLFTMPEEPESTQDVADLIDDLIIYSAQP